MQPPCGHRSAQASDDRPNRRQFSPGYTGKVSRIADFGAFVQILPGKDGLVHISQIAQERVEKVEYCLSEGQEIKVMVLDVDPGGRIKLTMKDVPEEEDEVDGDAA